MKPAIIKNEKPRNMSVETQLMEKFVSDFTLIANNLGLEKDSARSSATLGDIKSGSSIWFSIPGTCYFLCFGFDERKQGASIGIHFVGSRNAIMHTQLRSRLSAILGRHHADLGHPEWQYRLYLANSNRQDTYLENWYECDMKIRDGLRNGSVAKNLGFYLQMFVDELSILGLIGENVVGSPDSTNLVETEV